MAVPSSGQLSLFSIAKEIELNSYTSTIPYPTYQGISPYATPISLTNMSTGAGGFAAINTNSTDRPDGSTPHAMSEFYGYDQDAAFPGYQVYGADDWNDGDIGTGSRTGFGTTALEDASIYVPSSPVNNTPGTVSTRLSWSTSPQTTYTQPVVVSDTVRFRNTNNPHGMYIRTEDYTPSPSNFISITNVPTSQCVAWRFRFFMNSTNNKDQNIDLLMNTTTHPTQAGITTSTYLYQIRDNAGSGTGAIYFYKRTSGTTTLLATSPTTSYTLGTTKDFVASWHISGTGRSSTYTHRLAVGPTTTPTYTMIDTYGVLAVTDTTHPTNRGWTFRAPKAMSTPTSTHFHSVDVFSVSQISDPTAAP